MQNRRRLLTAILSGAILISACSGDSSQDTSPSTTLLAGTSAGAPGSSPSSANPPLASSTAAPSSSTTSTTSTTNKQTPVALTATVYIAGTKIELQSLANRGSDMVLSAKVTNHANQSDDAVGDHIGRTPVTFETPSGQRIELSPANVAKVPVGGFAPITWKGTQPTPAVALRDGRLVFGASSDNQSIVGASGDVTTIVPKTGVAVGSVIDSTRVRVEVVQGNLVGHYRFQNKGNYLLTLRISGTGKLETTGGYNFGTSNFTLKTPSGNVVAGEMPTDGPTLNEVLNANVTKTNWVQFVVSEKSGTFSLHYKERLDGGEFETAASFTIA